MANLVDLMAEAMCNSHCNGVTDEYFRSWEDSSEMVRAEYRIEARAALQAIRKFLPEIPEPRTVKSIRDEPNRLALVYTEGRRGDLYVHGHCKGHELIEYIDALQAQINTLEP